MISKIELKEMKFYAFHGVSPQETKVGNNFVVNLTLTANLYRAVETDNLLYTINYAEAYEIVKREMSLPSQLLEHIAGRILAALKETFPQLQEVTISVSKLTPPFGGDVHSATVVLEETWQ